MARRRRVDIFLILYLTAIVGFAVVSRERERTDTERRSRYEKLVRTFIPPLPVLPERDTIRYYVGAEDGSGIVNDAPRHFSTKIFVQDIDPDDQVTMVLHSIILDNTLTAPGLLRVGERTGYGAVQDRVIYFPLTGSFPRTGTYTINLVAHARRIKRSDGGTLEYRGIHVDTAHVPFGLMTALERSSATLTVQVIDTSLTRPKTLEPLSIQVGRENITSAVGFEEQNLVQVNLGWSVPSVSIVRGSGALHSVSLSDRVAEYRWVGTVSSFPDTIVIEARLNRDAGGKDIARARFVVSGSEPLLIEQPPQHLYAGEEMSVNMRVNGLNETELYSWSLFEDAGRNELLLKASGKGPVITYRIPTSYTGKRLVLETRYQGRLYSYVSTRSYQSGVSRISLPVETPPTRIVASIPDRAPANAAFRFSVSRYSQQRFMGEMPLDRIADVSVEIVNSKNRSLETSVSMIRKGEFEFELANTGSIAPGGEQIIIKIRAGDALFHHTMRLMR